MAAPTPSSPSPLRYDDLDALIQKGENSEVTRILEPLTLSQMYRLISVFGETLVHSAARHGNVPVLEVLLRDKRMEPNLLNHRSTSALIYAVIANQPAAIDCLLAHRAHPRMRSGFSGMTPAQQAASTDATKVLAVKLDAIDLALLPIGADKQLREGFSHCQAYKCRLYMWWRSNLDWHYNPLKHMVQGVDHIPEAQELMKHPDGLALLSDKCRELLAAWHTSIYEAVDGRDTSCIVCNTKTDQRCARCHSARFCSRECQRTAHFIHKFDCSAKQ